VVIKTVDTAVAGAAVKGAFADTGLADVAEVPKVTRFYLFLLKHRLSKGNLNGVSGIDFGGKVPKHSFNDNQNSVEAPK
jgi:hypothetical protein